MFAAGIVGGGQALERVVGVGWNALDSLHLHSEEMKVDSHKLFALFRFLLSLFPIKDTESLA